MVFGRVTIGMSCEAPAASGPPGLHTTTQELQTCTFEGSGASNTTKIPRKGPTREGEKNKNCGGRGKKKREILGPPTVRGPTLGAPPLRGPTLAGAHPSGPHPSGGPPFGAPLFLGLAPNPLGPHHDAKNIGQKIGFAKIGLAKIGLTKVGLFHSSSWKPIKNVAFGRRARRHDSQ